MAKWKASLAQDSDGIYNAQQMINQLTQGFPLVDDSTVQLSENILGDNDDWSAINYNEYYLFNSLAGKNSPDKEQLIIDKGLTFKIGDSSEWIQVAITQSAIGIKYNTSTTWSYLLNGTGGSGASGNYVVDNKDGTVYFNGATVTLATSKDIANVNATLALKQDKLSFAPADDSKVVHTTDMRKPASEVASIDEVSAKQDAIGFTPADDSKVVHTTGDEEIAGQKTFDDAPKLKSGDSLTTSAYVDTSINTVVNPLVNNTSWASLSVDSSQVENTDWEPSVTNLQYRIYHSTLYLTGQYIMLGVGSDKTHNSSILFKLPDTINSQISFPSTGTNKFVVGILQALAQQASMFIISLTSDGSITCVTNPYDLSTTYGASMAGGFINASIPLNN